MRGLEIGSVEVRHPSSTRRLRCRRALQGRFARELFRIVLAEHAKGCRDVIPPCRTSGRTAPGIGFCKPADRGGFQAGKVFFVCLAVLPVSCRVGDVVAAAFVAGTKGFFSSAALASRTRRHWEGQKRAGPGARRAKTLLSCNPSVCMFLRGTLWAGWASEQPTRARAGWPMIVPVGGCSKRPSHRAVSPGIGFLAGDSAVLAQQAGRPLSGSAGAGGRGGEAAKGGKAARPAAPRRACAAWTLIYKLNQQLILMAMAFPFAFVGGITQLTRCRMQLRGTVDRPPRLHCAGSGRGEKALLGVAFVGERGRALHSAVLGHAFFLS